MPLNSTIGQSEVSRFAPGDGVRDKSTGEYGTVLEVRPASSAIGIGGAAVGTGTAAIIVVYLHNKNVKQSFDVRWGESSESIEKVFHGAGTKAGQELAKLKTRSQSFLESKLGENFGIGELRSSIARPLHRGPLSLGEVGTKNQAPSGGQALTEEQMRHIAANKLAQQELQKKTLVGLGVSDASAQELAYLRSPKSARMQALTTQSTSALNDQVEALSQAAFGGSYVSGTPSSDSLEAAARPFSKGLATGETRLRQYKTLNAQMTEDVLNATVRLNKLAAAEGSSISAERRSLARTVERLTAQQKALNSRISGLSESLEFVTNAFGTDTSPGLTTRYRAVNDRLTGLFDSTGSLRLPRVGYEEFTSAPGAFVALERERTALLGDYFYGLKKTAELQSGRVSRYGPGMTEFFAGILGTWDDKEQGVRGGLLSAYKDTIAFNAQLADSNPNANTSLDSEEIADNLTLSTRRRNGLGDDSLRRQQTETAQNTINNIQLIEDIKAQKNYTSNSEAALADVFNASGLRSDSRYALSRDVTSNGFIDEVDKSFRALGSNALALSAKDPRTLTSVEKALLDKYNSTQRSLLDILRFPSDKAGTKTIVHQNRTLLLQDIKVNPNDLFGSEFTIGSIPIIGGRLIPVKESVVPDEIIPSTPAISTTLQQDNSASVEVAATKRANVIVLNDTNQPIRTGRQNFRPGSTQTLSREGLLDALQVGPNSSLTQFEEMLSRANVTSFFEGRSQFAGGQSAAGIITPDFMENDFTGEIYSRYQRIAANKVFTNKTQSLTQLRNETLTSAIYQFGLDNHIINANDIRSQLTTSDGKIIQGKSNPLSPELSAEMLKLAEKDSASSAERLKQLQFEQKAAELDSLADYQIDRAVSVVDSGAAVSEKVSFTSEHLSDFDTQLQKLIGKHPEIIKGYTQAQIIKSSPPIAGSPQSTQTFDKLLNNIVADYVEANFPLSSIGSTAEKAAIAQATAVEKLERYASLVLESRAVVGNDAFLKAKSNLNMYAHELTYGGIKTKFTEEEVRTAKAHLLVAKTKGSWSTVPIPDKTTPEGVVIPGRISPAEGLLNSRLPLLRQADKMTPEQRAFHGVHQDDQGRLYQEFDLSDKASREQTQRLRLTLQTKNGVEVISLLDEQNVAFSVGNIGRYTETIQAADVTNGFSYLRDNTVKAALNVSTGTSGPLFPVLSSKQRGKQNYVVYSGEGGVEGYREMVKRAQRAIEPSGYISKTVRSFDIETFRDGSDTAIGNIGYFQDGRTKSLHTSKYIEHLNKDEYLIGHRAANPNWSPSSFYEELVRKIRSETNAIATRSITAESKKIIKIVGLNETIDDVKDSAWKGLISMGDNDTHSEMITKIEAMVQRKAGMKKDGAGNITFTSGITLEEFNAAKSAAINELKKRHLLQTSKLVSDESVMLEKFYQSMSQGVHANSILYGQNISFDVEHIKERMKKLNVSGFGNSSIADAVDEPLKRLSQQSVNLQEIIPLVEPSSADNPLRYGQEAIGQRINPNSRELHLGVPDIEGAFGIGRHFKKQIRALDTSKITAVIPGLTPGRQFFDPESGRQYQLNSGYQGMKDGMFDAKTTGPGGLMIQEVDYGTGIAGKPFALSGIKAGRGSNFMAEKIGEMLKDTPEQVEAKTAAKIRQLANDRIRGLVDRKDKPGMLSRIDYWKSLTTNVFNEIDNAKASNTDVREHLSNYASNLLIQGDETSQRTAQYLKKYILPSDGAMAGGRTLAQLEQLRGFFGEVDTTHKPFLDQVRQSGLDTATSDRLVHNYFQEAYSKSTNFLPDAHHALLKQPIPETPILDYVRPASNMDASHLSDFGSSLLKKVEQERTNLTLPGPVNASVRKYGAQALASSLPTVSQLGDKGSDYLERKAATVSMLSSLPKADPGAARIYTHQKMAGSINKLFNNSIVKTGAVAALAIAAAAVIYQGGTKPDLGQDDREDKEHLRADFAVDKVEKTIKLNEIQMMERQSLMIKATGKSEGKVDSRVLNQAVGKIMDAHMNKVHQASTTQDERENIHARWTNRLDKSKWGA